MVHLDGLDFSGQVDGSEGDDHTGLDDSGFNTADGHCSNTSNFVDILKQLKGAFSITGLSRLMKTKIVVLCL